MPRSTPASRAFARVCEGPSSVCFASSRASWLAARGGRRFEERQAMVRYESRKLRPQPEGSLGIGDERIPKV
jgi:hypothetical protein